MNWKLKRRLTAGFLSLSLLAGLWTGPAAGAEEAASGCRSLDVAEEAGLSCFDKEASVREIQKYPNPEVLVSCTDAETADRFLASQAVCGISGQVERLDERAVLFSLTDWQTFRLALPALWQAEAVAYFQPNYRCSLNRMPSDPYFSKQWGLYNDGTFFPETPEYQSFSRYKANSDMDMNVPEAWDVLEQKQSVEGKRQIVVAVIDAGVDINHEDLKNVIWTNEDEVPGDGVDNDNNGYVDDVHGWNFTRESAMPFDNDPEDVHATHVAGIIGAEQNGVGIAGVASAADVKIMSIKCFGGEDGHGSLAEIIKSISYARENGADIINMSFGMEASPSSDENRMLTAAMQETDALFVVSAGNGEEADQGVGYDITLRPTYPASCEADNLLAVGGILWDGRLAVSSNYGAQSVDVAAPGMGIYSTFSNNAYGYMSGTSMATPMVSGVAALAMAYYGTATPQDICKMVNLTVKKINVLEGKVASGGIPDAYALLTSQDAAALAKKTPPEVVLEEEFVDADSTAKNLKIRVTDQEKDLIALCGTYGVRDAAYFEEGKKDRIAELEGAGGELVLPFAVTTSYTVYARDAYGYETVAHYQLDIREVVLDKTQQKIKKGEKIQLSPELNTNETVQYTFSSSKPKVASVNKKGVIKGRKKGTAVITVQAPHAKAVSVYVKVKA